MSREDWLKEAQSAEKAGSVATCQAIIAETIGMDVEEGERKKTWKEDAEMVCLLANEFIYCNRLWAVVTLLLLVQYSQMHLLCFRVKSLCGWAKLY